jgi:hypothetical protein
MGSRPLIGWIISSQANINGNVLERGNCAALLYYVVASHPIVVDRPEVKRQRRNVGKSGGGLDHTVGASLELKHGK